MKTIISLGAASLLVASSAASAATILAGDALNVAGLSAGESFQLVFVSSAEYTRTSEPSGDAAVAYWNGIVNTAADGSTATGGLNVGVASLNWSAIVSTAGTNARDNAVVSSTVYRLDGLVIANNNADMWDGSLDNSLSITENNATYSGDRWVWTGSSSDGTSSGSPLGTASTTRGQADLANTNWITIGSHQNRGTAEAERVYALSEVITVVPEPSSTALLGLGGLALLLRRRR